MKTTTNEQGKLTESATARHAAFDVVDLGPFDNNRNDLQAINDRGQGAGVSVNERTGRIEAFLQEPTAEEPGKQQTARRTSLGTLGGSFSIARDINNRGEVVGGSLTEGDENFHGFLYRDNRLYDLNELLQPDAGWEMIQAFAINNRGEIIGIGSQSGQDRIVLLRPRS
jgi:probable HAF family extracellular repeat protein